MIGEFIEILLLFNNAEEASQKKDYSDDVYSEASLVRKAFEKDREIHPSNNSYLAKVLQQEACKSEFTSQLQFNVSLCDTSQVILELNSEFNSELNSGLNSELNLESKQFDVLIWDNFIPVVENLEIISQINDLAPRVAMIITGEGNDDRKIMQILQSGAQDYLSYSEIAPKLLLRSMLKAIGRQQQRSLGVKPERTTKLISNNHLKSVTNKRITKENSKLCAEVQTKIIDDSQKNLKLLVARDITQHKQTEANLEKREKQKSENYLRKQSQSLVQLAKSKTLLQQGNLNAAFREITEIAAQTLEVERISIWLYNQDNSRLECINLYELSKQHHSCGKILAKENYPTYFQALATKRTIDVRDALNDPKTVELTTSYLEVHHIFSILYVPIWLWGRLVGVVSCEQVHEIRDWTLEEENFASSIADFASLAIEASDRATTEKALRRSERKLRAIFERSSIGIGLIDMSTRIVETNPALCLMLGYSHDQMYGKRFTDYISPDELKSDLELYQQLIVGMCDRFEMERRFVRRDGRIIWTYLSVSLLPSADGESKLFLAIIEDITEHKYTELKLRHSKEAAEAGSKAKSEFLATMSHELRTPLNAIMGLSQLLLQNIVGDLNDKQKEYVSCIYTSGEHLLALINDILDLSKVEAGREELLLAPLVIQDLCKIVISTVSDRAQEKGLELVVDIDPQAKICIADERRMKQMLLNLLTNAVKFTPKGKVLLLVKNVNLGIKFTVSDTGIGIDSSQFQSLFEPFRQLDSRLNRHYEGTGLGLALTRKLAQLHGGDITLRSKVGEGSSFTLFLPDRDTSDEWGTIQNDSEGSTSSISSSLFSSARTKRIALVEDEVHTANLLQDYLQTFGYRVELFKYTKDFFIQIRNYLPDLILLSTKLEGNNDGWDLLVQLRQQKNLQDLPVIIMIPMGMPKEYPQNLQNDQSKMKILEEAGAIDYLSKPIRTVQLESILMRYLS